MRAHRLLAVAVLGLSLTACAGIRDNQGYIYNQELTSSIEPGIDNRDSVQATLGQPTFTGQFGGTDWYYVTRLSSQFAFRRPRMTDTRVIRIQFDDAGNVVDVSERGPEAVASISPSGDKTPTLGRERSFFEEIFGNIGSVNQGGLPAPEQQ